MIFWICRLINVIALKLFFKRVKDFLRVTDNKGRMKFKNLHTASSRTDSFEKLIELCDSENESVILGYIENVLEGLDYRYVASVSLSEFFQYCINLIENGEYEELKRLLTGKVNKSVSESDKKANVIDMHSFKKAI